MKKTLNTIYIAICVISGICGMIEFYLTHFRASSVASQTETVSPQIPKSDTLQSIKLPQVQKKQLLDNGVEKSNFFITFIKTPVVYFVIILTAIAYFFVALFLFFINLFTKFSTGFGFAINVWDWGWHHVTINWYWNNAVSWHFWLSVFIWVFILSVINRR